MKLKINTLQPKYHFHSKNHFYSIFLIITLDQLKIRRFVRKIVPVPLFYVMDMCRFPNVSVQQLFTFKIGYHVEAFYF